MSLSSTRLRSSRHPGLSPRRYRDTKGRTMKPSGSRIRSGPEIIEWMNQPGEILKDPTTQRFHRLLSSEKEKRAHQVVTWS